MSELLLAWDRAPAFLDCVPQNTFGQAPAFLKEGPTTLRTLVTAPADWAGLGSILHGGFQALLLDDIMCRVITGLANGGMAVSQELTLRYHRPVQVDRPISLFGYLVEDQQQQIVTCAEIKDTQGSLLTEADGIFSRTEPENTQTEVGENTAWNDAQPDFVSLTHWPAWPACCKGPLERLWNLHVDWRLAPDHSALGGRLHFPPALRQIPAAGVLAALFDQALGLLGRVQGHGVLLTVRLQVTLYGQLPIDEELILLGRGYRRQAGPFKATAWLQRQNSLVAEATGNFSVLS
ncbi:MAG TPA: PaaI family thioesterase [Anaerolineae bacterium]|nr:PaaI family thioesterase [Anaerolineae bacterium]